MRPSSHAVAAASSLAGAFVGAAVALQLGVVELPGADRSTAQAPAGAPAAAVDASRADGTRPPRSSELRERRATVEALRLLHRWDARRERAWARGDAASLARLYTGRSVAGRRDVALLERYVARGWTVDGTTPRIVDAAVEERAADRVRLRLSEADPGAGPDLHARVVTLVRSTTGWRVGRVTAG
ncbi:hypothetical protein G7072_06470 [Nocardioides sp. HDW12B]|uniref:hypothetical protein n=1 Tax=Nocardioides sp. HDW12B TaxID=2714939 RepID=UPI001407B0BF|nr:hypothetical protein [Nocardioides sp. HDW12B]QIK66029.1 hypothetical protein G7072_06470 [Nocardioides sp. HDW12B]